MVLMGCQLGLPLLRGGMASSPGPGAEVGRARVLMAGVDLWRSCDHRAPSCSFSSPGWKVPQARKSCGRLLGAGTLEAPENGDLLARRKGTQGR